MLAEGQRLFHTVRHLRLEQVQGRAVRRFKRVRPGLGTAPHVRAPARAWEVHGTRRQSLFGSARFTFLNETHDIAAPSDWNNPDWPRLWTYNLHYFDDLNAVGADGRSDAHGALIQRWIVENPPTGGAGWEPYCLSLRIVNWCKWAWQGHDLSDVARQSLALQARALMQQVETHLLGNHLLANAKALIFAGAFFAGDEADSWRRRGLHFLRRELGEQVLADGGHFELSPMYHSVVLEDLLDLVQLARLFAAAVPTAVVDDLGRTCKSMLGWLDAATHPDGEISFFNDAAFGIAETPVALGNYGAALLGSGLEEVERPVRHLADSGLVRLAAGPAVMLADVGRIGPDHIPGHAHADTLSFELSVFGRRLLVNSGTSVYGAGAERLRQRGTAAHNTVVVNGQDSSEVWGGFRVARRARPGPVDISRSGEALCLSASHDGYRRLKGSVVHRRTWRLDVDGLRVDDRLDGGFDAATSCWRFHPDVLVTPRGNNAFDIDHDGRTLSVSFAGGVATPKTCRWMPEFGKAVPCNLLAFDLEGPESAFEVRWA